MALHASSEADPDTQTVVQQNIYGVGGPVLIDEGKFLLNGIFSRVFDGLDDLSVEASWIFSGQLKLGTAQAQPNGDIRYPIISGSFDGTPVTPGEQIPDLHGALDTSVHRYIQHNSDGTKLISVRFKIDHGFIDDLGELSFGGAMFYRLEMPIESFSQSYRITTGGEVPGADAFPLIPYPVADWNNDGTLNIADLTDYLMAYSSGDPTCDLDGDEMLTSEDISSFEDFHARSQGVPND